MPDTYKPLLLIRLHIIGYNTWSDYSYQQKKQFNYIVTATGKVIMLSAVDKKLPSIEVAFVGSEAYASASAALFGLLLDLWIQYDEVVIAYAKDLESNSAQALFPNARRWLLQHLPHKLKKKYYSYHNLLTLRALLPFI